MGNGATGGAIGGAANGASSGASVGGVPGAIVGGFLGGATGLMAGIAADDAEIARQNEINEYLAQIGAIDLPTYQQRKLDLQQYTQGQQYTPESVAALSQGDTKLAGVKEDPTLKQAQMQALADFQRRAQGGLTVTDQAALIDAQQNAARQNQGQQAAIIQNLAARGMGGGGAELAARMQAAQNSATNASNDSLKIAAQARESAINALRDSANLSGQMDDRQYGRDAQLAGTRDQIALRNLQNQQAVNTYNVGNRNNAQQQNIGRANHVADSNVNNANYQQEYNKKLLKQQYDDQMSRAGLIHGVKSGEANTEAAQAGNAASGVIGAIGGLGGLGKGLSDFAKSKENTGNYKTDGSYNYTKDEEDPGNLY